MRSGGGLRSWGGSGPGLPACGARGLDIVIQARDAENKMNELLSPRPVRQDCFQPTTNRRYLFKSCNCPLLPESALELEAAFEVDTVLSMARKNTVGDTGST